MTLQEVCDRYNMGDCEGLKALKEIANPCDWNEIDRLIDESWKVVEVTSESEENYHDAKWMMFRSYGFDFDDMGEMIIP